MLPTHSETTASRTDNFLQSCGVLDFLSAWRDAFHAGLILLATLGVLVSVGWVWILDRLWGIGGETIAPSIILRTYSCSLDSVLSVGALLLQHWFYALCLVLPLILLWSLLGGAVWRLIAVKRTGETSVSLGGALEFAAQHYWHGFVLTWALPLAFGVLVSVFLVIFGMFKAIPWLGDVIGGAFYFVPLFFGLLLAFGGLVLSVAGHLFGPGVAVGGDHGADAVTHSVSFAITKPVRAVLYLVATCLMTWITSLAVTGFIAGAEVLTEWLLGVGELMWSTHGESASDRTSDFLTSCWTRALQCAGMGSAACVFFAGSTVSFLLLRESVDGTPRKVAGRLGTTPHFAADAKKADGGTNATA